MAAAARTAPKTRGIDNIRVVAIDDAGAKDRLGIPLSITGKSPFFDRKA